MGWTESTYILRDIKNCNILCFTELWLNNDINNIQLAGYTLYRQDRTAASGKTRGDGLCIFVNNSWCTISKEVSRFCSPEVEYLIMISCRRHYLPRRFSSVFFVAAYIPPQTDAGTKNRTQWDVVMYSMGHKRLLRLLFNRLAGLVEMGWNRMQFSMPSNTTMLVDKKAVKGLLDTGTKSCFRIALYGHFEKAPHKL